MVNKSVTTEEILSMITEISTSLDRLENSYGETMNTARCKLWAKQYNMVNDVQNAMEKAGDFWSDPREESQSYPVKSMKTIISPKILAEV